MSAHALAAEPRSDMSLNIPPEFERAVLDRVASGAYETPEDVLKACLEGLSLLEAQLEEDHEWIREQIQLAREELDRGEGIPSDKARELILADVRRITGR